MFSFTFIFFLLYLFFFSSRRRHTRSTRDWSSECALPISSPTTDRSAAFPGGGNGIHFYPAPSGPGAEPLQLGWLFHLEVVPRLSGIHRRSRRPLRRFLHERVRRQLLPCWRLAQVAANMGDPDHRSPS